jgi:hypothetical protein
MRPWLLVGAAALVVIVAASWWLISKPTRVFEVDADALGSSLSREADQSGGECDAQQKDGTWICRIETDPGSGGFVTFELSADSEGCWKAQEIRVGHPNRPIRHGTVDSYSGCADLLDYVIPNKPVTP